MDEGAVSLKIIGIVHNSNSDDAVRDRKPGQISKIEVFPKFREALDGLEGFSHIFVISYFDRLRPQQIGPLKVKPRGLLRQGFTLEELPTIGVFALDSPTRPNPIGLSLVSLVNIRENELTVMDLDVFDGTPVLDIKPYQNSYRVDSFSLPNWHQKLLERAGRV